MSPPDTDHDGHADNHGTRWSYLIGFGLSALLTAVPFWLVMTGGHGGPSVVAAWVVALALVQIVVHTVFFLHVNARSEGGWTLLTLIFTVVIVSIVIAGSLWIMTHLNSNMMPMTPGSAPPAP